MAKIAVPSNHNCYEYLPRARKRRAGQLHACPMCMRLYVSAVRTGEMGRVFASWTPAVLILRDPIRTGSSRGRVFVEARPQNDND